MQKPEAVERASPEDIAILSMEFGRLLMECGASARIVDDIVGRRPIKRSLSPFKMRSGSCLRSVPWGPASRFPPCSCAYADSMNSKVWNPVKTLQLKRQCAIHPVRTKYSAERALKLEIHDGDRCFNSGANGVDSKHIVVMQTILPSEFKRQMVVMLDGSPHVIEDMHTSGTAQTRHKLHTRLRHLTTGRVIDRVFAENERVPVAPLETRRATYSYAQGDTRIFADIETFDEFEFSNEQLAERLWFLKENEEYKVLRLDGRLLDIVLPPQISLKVVDTAPASRTALNSSWKEAKLETGLQIMVPLFVANGDILRVDTTEKKYLGKDTSIE